jgi:hypothetical protein
LENNIRTEGEENVYSTEEITKVAAETATAGAGKAKCVVPEDPLDGYQGHNGEGLKDHGE